MVHSRDPVRVRADRRLCLYRGKRGIHNTVCTQIK